MTELKFVKTVDITYFIYNSVGYVKRYIRRTTEPQDLTYVYGNFLPFPLILKLEGHVDVEEIKAALDSRLS